MRLVTRTFAVRKFSELSEKAKEHAKQQEMGSTGYSRDAEAMKSLRKLAAHFGGSLHGWCIDWFAGSHSSAEFCMPEDMERDEIAERLGKLGTYNPETLKGLGDCALTGFGIDEDAIDGFRAAFHANENSLSHLMDAAFKTWLKACQADCEDQYSDETFSENCDANDYEFTDDGELFTD